MNDSGIHNVVESTPMCAAKKSKLHDIKANFSLLPSPIMPFISRTSGDPLVTKLETINIYHLSPSPAATSPLEFYKNHHECMQRTPMKSSSSSKLGSPERNEIISGRRPTAIKWKTPKVERSSPAKKRLFGLQNNSTGSITKSKRLIATHLTHDPINLFTKVKSMPCIVEEIFGHLQAVDLYHCRRVNRTWKAAVDSFPAFKKAAADFSNKLWLNKENPKELRSLQMGPLQVQVQKTASVFLDGDKFIQLGTTLKENQSLTKCPRCQDPQILEHNIGQCQNYNCGYICCFKCHSFSSEGPEYFVDKCNSSALDIGRPKRRTLSDSPPHSQFSFLAASSPMPSDNSHLYASSARDSCYGTYDELTPPFTPGSSDSSGGMHPSSVSCQRKSLGDSNRQDECKKSLTCRTNLYTPVLPLRGKSPEKLDDSPVKEYRGACTKSSKKRLRRLLK